MFKYQKGSWEIEAFSIMLLLLVIAIWFTVRTLTMHNELNEALTDADVTDMTDLMYQLIKKNGG